MHLLKVCIIDDEKMQEFLSNFVEKWFGSIEIVSDTDIRSAKIFVDTRTHLLIVNLEMQEDPDASLRIINKLRRQHTKLKVILFSELTDETTTVLLRRGIDGLLSRSADEQEIFDALASVFMGGRYFSEHFVVRIFNHTLNNQKSAGLSS